jgi:hypothetical protein
VSRTGDDRSRLSVLLPDLHPSALGRRVQCCQWQPLDESCHLHAQANLTWWKKGRWPPKPYAGKLALQMADPSLFGLRSTSPPFLALSSINRSTVHVRTGNPLAAPAKYSRSLTSLGPSIPFFLQDLRYSSIRSGCRRQLLLSIGCSLFRSI